VAGSLAVQGLLQLGDGTCNAAAEGSIRYNKAMKSVEVCDGVSWRVVAAFKVASFFLHAEKSLVDEYGNYAFLSTAALVWSTEHSKGANSFATDVYWGSPADWAVVTDKPDKAWSLGPSAGNFTFEWDYRHTGDTGYGAVLFANATGWVDSTYTYINQNESECAKLPSGWMIAMYWGATRLYFNSSVGIVSWPYPGYHSSWKSLKLTRTGNTMEFFIDGAGQGTRTAPAITDDQASLLYIAGSTNGGEKSYGQGTYSLRYQMDEVRVTIGK
jgi:hypothetical protein